MYALSTGEERGETGEGGQGEEEEEKEKSGIGLTECGGGLVSQQTPRLGGEGWVGVFLCRDWLKLTLIPPPIPKPPLPSFAPHIAPFPSSHLAMPSVCRVSNFGVSSFLSLFRAVDDGFLGFSPIFASPPKTGEKVFFFPPNELQSIFSASVAIIRKDETLEGD